MATEGAGPLGFMLCSLTVALMTRPLANELPSAQKQEVDRGLQSEIHRVTVAADGSVTVKFRNKVFIYTTLTEI